MTNLSLLRLLRHTALLAIAFLASHRARAQTWVPVGPPGGDVRALAADPERPQVVYLGTANGVLYRSDDAGQRWQRTAPGFPLRGVSLDEIVVDTRGDVLVGYWEVSGSGGGVARSTDGGRSFTLLADIKGQSVRALAVAPSNADILVAGTITGVFRSDDAGRTWRRISPEGPAEIRNVESLAIDPSDPQVVYVGTWHLPWKTLDGGRTWRSAPAGMIDDSDVMTLTVDRRNPRTVYATACTGIYRSLDAAGRWSKVAGIPSSSRRTRAFAQDPARPQNLYAGTTEGLWASRDGGATWRLLTAKDLVVNTVVALPGGVVLLGCEGAGVLRSTDEGSTFTASNHGFSERLVSRVLFDRTRGRVLVGLLGDRSHGGVFTAPEPTGPWSKLGSGLEGRGVLSLALAGSDLLAGTDAGLFQHEGGGWRRMPTVVGGIDEHPRIEDLLALSPRVLLAATPRGLLRSDDGGRNWERRSLGLSAAVSALAVSPQDRGLVLATTPLGLFRSGDAGASWDLVSRGFVEASIQALAFLPGDDRVVFATSAHGLFRSTDQGRTWSRRGGGLPYSNITGLALDPDGQTVYASDFTYGGVFRSGDAGESWVRLPTAGLVSDRVWAVALDPEAPTRVLAAAAAGGLHLLSPPAAGQAAGTQ